MGLLSKPDLIAALSRLGELALERGDRVELLRLGDSAMVLVFDARESTKDVDVVVLSPEAARVRELAQIVATERNWPADWLNDAA